MPEGILWRQAPTTNKKARMFRRILRRTLRSCAGSFVWTLRCAGSCTLGEKCAKNRKGQDLGLNMRLLLSKDRLSTLGHKGSYQRA
eukprot:scaffold6392_cov118-Isochrysis_galbana.AAC.6